MNCARRHRRKGTAVLLAVAALPLLLATLPAAAQQGQSVVTIPRAVSTKGANASGTIASTGVFQLLFAATPSSPGGQPRAGCTIQNNGSHTMYVTEGLGTAASTTALAWTLTAGQSANCQFGGVVLQGEVDITGTTGDSFYAAQE